MRFKSGYILSIILAVTLISNNVFSQHITLNAQESRKHFNLLFEPESVTNSTTPFAVGAAILIYLVNPTFQYRDSKLFAGLTKEISVGFGKLGEHRMSFEYSFIFSGNIEHHVRLGYKYDYLLEDLRPSNMLQGTTVLTFGAGYFTDFRGNAVFPEIAFGYSLRNHKLLFYPHLKLRHTFALTKEMKDVTDFSFGLMFGIANPFSDLKIRRNYK